MNVLIYEENDKPPHAFHDVRVARRLENVMKTLEKVRDARRYIRPLWRTASVLKSVVCYDLSGIECRTLDDLRPMFLFQPTFLPRVAYLFSHRRVLY